MVALREFFAALAHASTWRLALRGLGRQPRRSAIVLTAVAIGLASVLLAMALNYGLVLQMVETAVRSEVGDLQIHARAFRDVDPLAERMAEAPVLAALTPLPSLAGIAPRLRGQGLAQSARASVGVRVLAVDPAREPSVTSLARSVTRGAWLGAPARGGAREPTRVVVGVGLARQLGLRLGAKFVLHAIDASGLEAATSARIAGVLELPSRELDESVVWMPLADGQALYGVPGEISEVALAVRDRAELEGVKRDVERALGVALRVETWREREPLLNGMLAVFDSMGWILYAVTFVAMAFGIANVLLMSVLERTREIGVLLALGMPPARMVAIVVAEGLVLVGIGVALGFALGFACLYALHDGIDVSRFRAGMRSFGVAPRLAPVARSGDVWAPLALAVATALAASLWPALRVVRTRPAEALRRV
jgi:ABC-type lipoprotein release transport system permease subunit